MQTFHLAELNIAKARYADEDPRFQAFIDMIGPVNEMAERMPGYIWRLTDDDGVGTMAIKSFSDPQMLVNLSVWDSLESLEDFIHKTVHAKVMARRKEWFDALDSHHMVLWWVPAGHRPDLEEAKAKLTHLDTHGPSAAAFTFGHVFSPGGEPVQFQV